MAVRLKDIEPPRNPMNTKAAEPRLGGTPVDGARYTSRDFFRAEWEGVWTRIWIVGARADEIPEPGDFVTQDVGPESVLIVRQDDRSIKAFYNVCQHRGNRLCYGEEGQSPDFVCSYHGWRYAKDGRLLHVQDADDFKQGDPCAHLRLAEVPCAEFGGFVWFNMDPDCRPLRESLAPLADQIEPYALEGLTRVQFHRMEMPCNWKIVIENFLEAYHTQIVHPGLGDVLDETKEDVQYDLYPSGHTRMWMKGSHPGPTSRYKEEVDGPVREILLDWELDPAAFRGRFRAIRPALADQKRRLGPARGFDFSRLTDEQLVDNYLFDFFPNMAWSIYPEGRFMWLLRSLPHARDPETCYFEMWTFARFRPGEDEFYYPHFRRTFRRGAVERHVGVYPEISFDPGINQDISIMPGQQLGLRSRGFRNAYLCEQERRLQFLHENIDRMIRGERLG